MAIAETATAEMTTIPFDEDELDLAQLFKALGMHWTPACGHYVLDQGNLIEVDSPFQDRVYFILDLKHFLRRAGTIEELKSRMCWLPTWEQARDILRREGVTDAVVSRRMEETQAIARGKERLELYRLIEEKITGVLNDEELP